MPMRSKAFTLVELMMGMAVTALVGLAAAGVSRTLGDSYVQSQHYYESIQCTRIGMMRLASEIRQAKLVTELGSAQLMLWQEPAGGDGGINLSELTLITYDPNADTINKYQVVFPTSWPAWLRQLMDSQVSLASLVSNPSYWASQIKTSSYVQTKALAGSITAVQYSSTQAGAPYTTLLTIQITAGSGGSGVTLRNSVKLRADRTSNVGQL